jgi:hypothetical protein
MASYKNISDNWYITVNNGTGTIYVDGNLDVTGNITYVSELAVNDAFIVVAANNPGSVTNMGLVATQNANTGLYAGLRFNTITSAWEISPSVTANGAPVSAYSAIATGNATVGGANTEIQFNNTGSFSANINLRYDFTTSTLTLQGHQVLGNIGTTPASTANSVTVYNKEQGLGGTGLYVLSSTVNDETVAYTKARLYSIIY